MTKPATDKNLTLTSVFLGLYLVCALISMGVGAAIYDYSLAPRPGAWYPIILGLPAFVLGVYFVKNDVNNAARIGFILVGSLAAMVMFIGVIVDGSYATFAHRMDNCFSYNTNANQASRCCSLSRPGAFNTSAMSFSECIAPYSQTPSHECLCCRFSDQTVSKWTVRGDCEDIPSKLSKALGASCAFNLFCTMLIMAALLTTCCRCCGPPQYVEAPVVARVSRNSFDGSSTPTSSAPSTFFHGNTRRDDDAVYADSIIVVP